MSTVSGLLQADILINRRLGPDRWQGFDALKRTSYSVPRAGAPKAITATARKLAVLYYTMLKNGSSYVEVGQAAYEQRYRQRRFSAMQKQALAMGYQLVPA